MSTQKKKTQTALNLILMTAVIGLGILAFRDAPSPSAQAQVPTIPDAELRTLTTNIERFFEGISEAGNTNKDPAVAIRELLRNSPLNPDTNFIASLSASIKEINTRFGTYLSIEKIDTKAVGRDLISFKYLYKCQNYPVVWRFTYYRPPVTQLATTDTGSTPAGTTSRPWILIDLRYDSNLDLLLF